MQEHLANYYILRWDEDSLSYKHVEHWGIKFAEVNERLEKLGLIYGRKNLIVVANLDVVMRADVRSMVRKITEGFNKK